MRVLHLAAGNRWTGAAAPAFAEVEALRAAGIEAHYAYVGGYKLEEKLRDVAFAHPIIEKAQNPAAFVRTTRALRSLIRRHAIDVVHAHLTYDHWLGRFAVRGTDARLARTFHARRVLRTDVFTRSLIRATPLLFVINDAFRDAAAFVGRDAIFTPPPLDHRQFTPDGADARAMQGIAADEKIVTVIGKVAPGRGFEEALRTFAALRRRVVCRLMIIGHGPHRPFLEQLSRDLGVAEQVIWAGYHETDLAEHYRAANLLLFTAKGSDEGHRAVLEAMACGVPPATYPIEGMTALTGATHVAATAGPEALATVAESVLARNLRDEVIARSRTFGYAEAAQRLLAAYRAR